ncbi:hypothetical protein [Desulfovibrio inopinatus]|uniref:hypothetical protein n=1 Tax=Desulfovibrio inopinatus TaxID=102109 RepID=UPI000683FD7D|nr:hypothetical protein [Desulfovibrio inopinatus]
MMNHLKAHQAKSMVQKLDNVRQHAANTYARLLLILLCGGIVFCNTAHAGKSQLVGGPCTYFTTEGVAHILSISPDLSASNLPYTAQKILFTYKPQSDAAKTGLHTQNKTFVFTLTNGILPGPRYIARYKLRPGIDIPVHLKTITKGTCTPVVFDFPTLDQSDYFELKSD